MKKFAKWLRSGRTPTPTPAESIDPQAPVDLLGPAFIADPYPTYAALRASRPVAPTTSGGLLLTRHADILAAFPDDRLSNAPSRFSTLNARNRAKYPAADLAANIPPFLDMPGHRLPRQALTRAFFNTFRDFAPVVEDVAARFAGDASGDFTVQDLSRPFALYCMARFTGLPDEPGALKAITQAFFHLFAPITDPSGFARTNAALTEARAQVAAALEARRAAPGADLLSELLAFQADTPGLTDQQIIDNTILVLADGVENIEAGAATLLHLFAQQACLDAVATGSQAAEPFVREALRLQTPGQVVPRVARESFVLGGEDIPEGMPVLLALASANRDAEAFDAPDAFRPERAEQPVTFGLGRHRCIGEKLGVLLLSTFSAAAASAGIRPRDPATPLSFQPRFGHRWPDPLPARRG